MVTISKADAIAAVRKNLDEQGLNESVMYGDENADNDSLDSIIAKTLPEAINDIHRIAPVYLLEGEDITAFKECGFDGGVLFFTFDADCLRLAAFQATDSAIVVTDVIPEASAEGRKQLNQYIRGTYDNPRLVQVQGVTYLPSFRYYSLKDDTYKDNPKAAIKQLKVVKQQSWSASAESYPASADLVDSIIYQLTALVCQIYGKTDAATYFSNKATKWKTS